MPEFVARGLKPGFTRLELLPCASGQLSLSKKVLAVLSVRAINPLTNVAHCTLHIALADIPKYEVINDSRADHNEIH
jgi:hypothetical protein